MPILTVKSGKEEYRIPFIAAHSLRDILDATDVRVRSGCRGKGSCGLCRVRIEAGEAGPPTPNERVYLGPAELGQGIRLACQVVPEKDLRIELLAPAPKSRWRTLPGGMAQRGRRSPVIPLQELPRNVSTPYGVAVDLGTTHITLSLYDLYCGRWLAGRYGVNPQMIHGSDVMTRLVAASEFPELAGEMSRQVVSAIGEALLDMAVREGIDIGQVVRLVLVGNTAMLALLSGRNYGALLQPGLWMTPLDCLPENPGTWTHSFGIHPEARIEALPPLAGFVGSDLLAGVVTTRLTETGGGGLFIDFGTNSEIALWDGWTLWVTSAAGGPAFEESGISCGAPAEAGAIYRFGCRDGLFDFSVIGDCEPRGICGSGLVDLIACLVRSGLLSDLGRFVPPVPGKGFALVRGERDILLSKRDVDMFQRAKAAIGAGVQVLLAHAAMGRAELRRICIGGFFGRFLDVANAREIGLLPGKPPDPVELCGNTSLAGCADTLLSSVALDRLKNLHDYARLIDLSHCPEFNEQFLNNLYLRPMQGE
jgi:uncharacterized 2Fe-2S/4Fe-4S cluster protein (DUF4445 family)